LSIAEDNARSASLCKIYETIKKQLHQVPNQKIVGIAKAIKNKFKNLNLAEIMTELKKLFPNETQEVIIDITSWIVGGEKEFLQRAVDEIHIAEFGEGKGKGFPMAVTKLRDGTVIVSKVGGKPGLKAQVKAKEIFGEDVVFAGGTVNGNLKGVAGHHAEQRAIATAINNGLDVKGATQSCTHYSCTDCEKVQNEYEIINITGTFSQHGKISRQIGGK